jgi:hypothetical protein
VGFLVAVGVGFLVAVGVGFLVAVGVGFLVAVGVGFPVGVGVADKIPVPLRRTVGTGAEASTVRIPVRSPAALGANLTETLQLEPAPSVAPQVVEDAAKSPLAVILEMKIREVPSLVNVTSRGVLVVLTSCLANTRTLGDPVTQVPVPLKLAVCGLLSALS